MSDSIISVRVSETQKKSIQAFADSLGLSVSSFALALMLDAVSKQSLNIGPGQSMTAQKANALLADRDLNDDKPAQ